MRHDKLLCNLVEGRMVGKLTKCRKISDDLYDNKDYETLNRRQEYTEEKQYKTRGQSNLTKSASRGAHSPVRGHPRGSKVVPLNSWGRGSY